jgi:hypothetical protein
MAATPTRTLNPLPFQDLEPHRFEDLVRQLVYGFRPWTSLEAVGRGGSDEGIDIRGIELGAAVDLDTAEEDGGEDEPELRSSGAERLWIIQCKREKSLGPAAVRRVVAESLRSLQTPPFGFILAVASDVSRKARDVFREEMVARGIEQFAIWARGELEDRLFQPENDHLLFAYFNLSLRARRRSAVTTIRSEIAIKKQLQKLLDDRSNGGFVLLRDPEDGRYPDDPAAGEPPARWLLCRLLHLRAPSRAIFVVHERLAALTEDHEGWDAIDTSDVLPGQAAAQLRGKNAWRADDGDGDDGERAVAFWREYVEEGQRAHLIEYRRVHLRRVLAIDWQGDGFYPIPHVFVASLPNGDLFEPGAGHYLDLLSRHAGALSAHPEDRVSIFPCPIPDEDEPPLAIFDQTLPTTKALPEPLRATLASKLALPESSREPEGATERRRPKEGAASKAFKQWREKVARPLLSAYVHILREQGQRARVVVIGDQALRGRGPAEISLRLNIKRTSPHNPLYWADGHVTVSFDEHAGWRVRLSHEPGNGRSYGSGRALPNGEPSAEDLHGWVESVIDEITRRS